MTKPDQVAFNEHTVVVLRELARKIEAGEATVDMMRPEGKPDEGKSVDYEQSDGSVETPPVHETEGRLQLTVVYLPVKERVG